MSKVLIVENIPFNYPNPGEDPGWGQGATGWAEAVTNALANLSGPGDITQTSFSIANNQVAPQDIDGLVFDGGTVRSAVITYSIYRISDTSPDGNAETGQIVLLYDNNLGWSLAQGQIVGFAGVYFSITNVGQFQYTSTDIGVLSYQGGIRFSAKAVTQ